MTINRDMYYSPGDDFEEDEADEERPGDGECGAL